MFMKYTCDTILHIFWSRTWTQEERGCKKHLHLRRAYKEGSALKPIRDQSSFCTFYKNTTALLFKIHTSWSFDQCAFKITPLSVHLHFNFFFCNSKINCSCTAPIAPPSIPSCLTWTKKFWPPPNLISTPLVMFSTYILLVMTKTKRQINFRKKIGTFWLNYFLKPFCSIANT